MGQVPDIDLPAQLQLLTTLLDQMPVGVVVLDAVGTVVHFNRYEEQLARRDRAEVLGTRFFVDVAPCMNIKALGGHFFERIGREPLQAATEFNFPFPFLETPREVMVRMTDFRVDGRPYGMLLVEDVSARRAVDRMKETLTSLLVHDLKNPLAVILANLTYVQSTPQVSAHPDLVEALTDGIDGGIRLQQMIVNLLDITRLEAGTMPLQRAVINVGDLVSKVVGDTQGSARERRATLVAERPNEPLFALLDADVLRRALDNLVNNALRYCRSGGRIIVGVQTASAGIEILVSDNGPGIPEAARASIFEKYTQAGAATPGSLNRGLGLTFVKLAVEAHGGDVTVECPATGGTTFRLKLPIEAEHHSRRSSRAPAT